MSLASLDQLDRSHRRHDDVMTQLLEAARRIAAGRPHDSDTDVVRDAIAYFDRAVTRHFLDEEGSVFPRLSTRRPELAEALAALSSEHPAQIALHNAVAECAKQLDGDSRQGAGKALLELAEQLADQHRQHVAREDEIFRTAHEALTAQDDSDIVSEMETRRDRDAEEGGHARHHGGGGGGGGRGGGGGGGGGRRHQRAATASTKQRATASTKQRPAAASKRPAASSAKTTKRAAKTARSIRKPVKKKPARKRASR